MDARVPDRPAPLRVERPEIAVERSENRPRLAVPPAERSASSLRRSLPPRPESRFWPEAAPCPGSRGSFPPPGRSIPRPRGVDPHLERPRPPLSPPRSPPSSIDSPRSMKSVPRGPRSSKLGHRPPKGQFVTREEGARAPATGRERPSTGRQARDEVLVRTSGTGPRPDFGDRSVRTSGTGPRCSASNGPHRRPLAVTAGPRGPVGAAARRRKPRLPRFRARWAPPGVRRSSRPQDARRRRVPVDAAASRACSASPALRKLMRRVSTTAPRTGMSGAVPPIGHGKMRSAQLVV